MNQSVVPVPCPICGELPTVVQSNIKVQRHKARCPNGDRDDHRFGGHKGWKYGKTAGGAIRKWNDSHGIEGDMERELKPLGDVTPCPLCCLRGPHECMYSESHDAFYRDGEPRTVGHVAR